LQLAQLELEASLDFKRHRNTRVRLALGKTTRNFLSAIACAAWLERSPILLPNTLRLRPDGKSQTIYLVDSALYAKELTILVEGEAGVEFTASLEASLLGKIQPQFLLRSASRLVITGTGSTPFALTCFETSADETGRLAGISLSPGGPRAAATDVALVSSASHAALGQPNEFIDFDE
jgi:hypothetical protein